MTTTVGKLRSMLNELHPDLPVVFAVGENDYVPVNIMVIQEQPDRAQVKLAEYDHWDRERVSYFEITDYFK